MTLCFYAKGAQWACMDVADCPHTPPSAPVYIDRERMENALKGPRIVIPSGLTPEQIVEFINSHAEKLK